MHTYVTMEGLLGRFQALPRPGSVNQLCAGTVFLKLYIQVPPTATGCLHAAHSSLTWGAAGLPLEQTMRYGSWLKHPHGSLWDLCLHAGRTAQVQVRPQHSGAHWSTCDTSCSCKSPQAPITRHINHTAWTLAGAGLLRVHRC